MIDALASLTAWIIVGSLAFLAAGWLLWPVLRAGAEGIGRLIGWTASRRG